MSDLFNKIESEVNKSGTPLEMYVAQRFIKAGWTVSHLTHYKDENGPLREIDLVCQPKHSHNMKVVVSCKTSSSDHWILHSVNNPQSKRIDKYLSQNNNTDLPGYITTPFLIKPNFFQPYFSEKLDSYLQMLQVDASGQDKEKFEPNVLNDFFTYMNPDRISIFQSVLNRSNSSDLPIRTAASSAISAIKSLSNYSADPITDLNSYWIDDPSLYEIDFWIPLIVFGGKLFETYYGDNYENVFLSDDGTISSRSEIREVDSIRCSFATDFEVHPFSEGYSMLGIDIVTPRHIDKAIESIETANSILYDLECTTSILEDFKTFLKIYGTIRKF
jgi:hypothetical protein